MDSFHRSIPKKWELTQCVWRFHRRTCKLGAMFPCVRFPAVCLLLFLGSCGEMVVKPHAPKKPEVVKDESWADFQKALERSDIEKVASMVDFPLPNDLEGLGREFEGIGSRKTFRRDFDTLFPNEVIGTLIGYSPSAEEIRAGRWSVAHDEPNDISEMEWSMYYQFARASDGRIRLKRIQMAG